MELQDEIKLIMWKKHRTSSKLTITKADDIVDDIFMIIAEGITAKEYARGE